jgi:NTP pyrophosphatase (non-canonical NTP hydrolase)
VGTSLNRQAISEDQIETGINDLAITLASRLAKKGPGSYASRHEILGIITEEYLEAVEAIREDGPEGYEHYAEELMDIAVACLFGYVCMHSGNITP